MLIPARTFLRTTLAVRPSTASYGPPCRGLCRLMLRTGSEATPSASADQDTFDEQLKSSKSIKRSRAVHDAAIESDKAQAKAQAAETDKSKTNVKGKESAKKTLLSLFPATEEGLIECQKAARAAAEENRGFEDGLKGCHPVVPKDEVEGERATA